MRQLTDLIGQRFERLIVKSVVHHKNRRQWSCLCACGRTTIASAHELRTKHTQSCGCLDAERRAKRTAASIRVKVGDVYGRLRVVGRASNSLNGQSRWECLCVCSEPRTIAASDLSSGHSRSCGCLERELASTRSLKNISGQIFGYYEVISRVPTPSSEKRQKQARWLCRCICGTERVIKGLYLRNGNSKSCGCKTSEIISAAERKHGMSHRKASEYTTWLGMRQRCRNPHSRKYKDYGGRGIKVCRRWDSFELFLADVGMRPIGKTLDRINVNGNYEPGNVRWATASEQASNKRPRPSVSK